MNVLKNVFLKFYKKRDRESFYSDLEEVYFDTVEKHGEIYAAGWLIMQMIRSLPSAFMNWTYWSLNMYKNYFKITFRNIKRYKGYSFINISGLAVGIACCILTLLWVRYELSYDNFHENSKDLYRVIFHDPKIGWGGTIMPGAIANHLKNEFPEIINASLINEAGERKLTFKKSSLNCTGHFVHSSFLDMFTFPLVKGDPENPFSTKFSVVITEDLALRLFGEEDPMDKRIKFDDSYLYTVTGILKNIPGNSHFKYDYLLPVKGAPANYNFNSWEIWTSCIYLQLQENTSHTEVNDKMSNVFNDRMQKESKRNMYLQPFGDVHLHAPNGGGLISYIYIFMGMGVAILLVACFNFMNLATACAEKRFREIGIKKVVGSTRRQLISQFISESMLLSFIALIIAVFIAVLMLPFINNLIGQRMVMEFSPDIVFGLIGITFLTGILAGSYPAFFLSSFSPLRVLKGQLFSKSQKGSALFRRLLVVTQFSLSISFVICVLVINNQLEFMQNKDLGFNKEHIVRVQLKGRLLSRGHILKEAVQGNSDILNISRAYSTLTRWESSGGIDWEGRKTGHVVITGNNWVDYDYLKTFDLELVDGRYFSTEHPSDFREAVILNEAAVKAMGIENPVGLTVVRMYATQNPERRTIIGVVKDYHTQSLHTPIRPYMLIPGLRGDNLFVRMKPGNISGVLESIREKVREIVPNDPFVYSFVDEEINRLYKNEQATGKLIVVIAVVAIIISSLGLFGLAAFTAEQRTKEIGIRKSLGSSTGKIMMLLSRELLICILLANLVAWPAVYFSLKKWLQVFAYQTDLNWDIFVFSGLLALIITISTVSYRSFTAAAANPVDSLRYE